MYKLVKCMQSSCYICRLPHFACAHRYVITCGGDSDVRTFEDIDDDSCAEFSVASDRVTAIVCWYASDQVSRCSFSVYCKLMFVRMEYACLLIIWYITSSNMDIAGLLIE